MWKTEAAVGELRRLWIKTIVKRIVAREAQVRCTETGWLASIPVYVRCLEKYAFKLAASKDDYMSCEVVRNKGKQILELMTAEERAFIKKWRNLG